MTKSTTDSPRGAIGLLADPVFGSFFAARLLTSIGIWLHMIVAAIAAFEATHSAVAVGIVSLVQFAPQLVLAPISGKWADKGDVKRQMLLGRMLCGLGSLVLVFWYLFASDPTGWTSASVVAIGSFVAGVGLVVGGPAMQSGIPLLVKHEELPAAMALNTAPITIGRVAGPALGALATAGFGYEWAFLAAAACHLGFILLVFWITFPKPEGHSDDNAYSIREALRFVRSDRPTLLILVGVTALGFGSEPTVTLAPALAHELGGGAGAVGVLTTAVGLGAAVGVLIMSLLAAKIRQDVFVTVGISMMAVGMGLCVVPLNVTLAALAFGLTGVGFIMSVSCLSTLLQMRLPALLRGRVMALWLMGFVGSRPIGAILVGALADAFVVQAAFAVIAVLLVIAAVLCRPSQLRKSHPDGRENRTAPPLVIDQ